MTLFVIVIYHRCGGSSTVCRISTWLYMDDYLGMLLLLTVYHRNWIDLSISQHVTITNYAKCMKKVRVILWTFPLTWFSPALHVTPLAIRTVQIPTVTHSPTRTSRISSVLLVEKDRGRSSKYPSTLLNLDEGRVSKRVSKEFTDLHPHPGYLYPSIRTYTRVHNHTQEHHSNQPAHTVSYCKHISNDCKQP